MCGLDFQVSNGIDTYPPTRNTIAFFNKLKEVSLFFVLRFTERWGFVPNVKKNPCRHNAEHEFPINEPLKVKFFKSA